MEEANWKHILEQRKQEALIIANTSEKTIRVFHINIECMWEIKFWVRKDRIQNPIKTLTTRSTVR